VPNKENMNNKESIESQDSEFKSKMGVSKKVHLISLFGTIISIVIFFIALENKDHIQGWAILTYPVILFAASFFVGYWYTGKARDGFYSMLKFLYFLIAAVVLGLLVRFFKLH
jgi:hypothetical protein